MAPRGRKRKFNPNIPAHINQDNLPNNCYWDSSGNGHWFTTYQDERGKQRRKRIAGSGAMLSDLHKILEEWKGIERDTFRWLCDLYFDSNKHKALKLETRKSYQTYYKKLAEIPTKLNKPLVDTPISRWDSFLVQKAIDKITKERGPTAAKHTHSFIRLVFVWGKNRGYCNVNPARGTELPKERKKQKLPSEDAFRRLLSHAKAHGTHKEKTKGSCPYYIWVIMELEYLCRMRGIECRNMTDANILEEGLLINRTKGSRDNIVLWNSRLRNCIDYAVKARKDILEKNSRPFALKAENRLLIVNNSGDRLSESGYHSAWQRFMKQVINAGVINQEERFGLHDLKRKGVTDTTGNRHDKQEASGHKSESMMDVYDKSLARVQPASE